MERCRDVLLMALDMRQAARGVPPVASCLVLTNSVTASEAQTSKGLGCTGIRTKSATRMAAEVLSVNFAGQSMTMTSYSLRKSLA